MKKYLVRYNIGKVKYSIDLYNGIKTNKDGSEFWDILTFTNKKDLSNKEKELDQKGYVRLWIS